ncbi:3',5'-cyclic-AMP phosphodiesterase [Testudinibacter sp. TR-2022]|uniref:3',5'-cyclic-AMP phosphodiesterase n=1 Tax=Testudinibacter sp. TR-2022 TaxID=2585029 RepID=UPI001119B89D|nr:3',5'-cyclic-AMP phosphodiesterase [Testudinibacter sp. TR-2022]TNH06847.1 3',5'-cyclic-AMP phosphodiesterase [Pasteurellaceae bacterium Phil11]TNH25615.1 3',5'-cyclic-AMP phosphodiesterase [Testudinibacter sp. TR-2022]
MRTTFLHHSDKLPVRFIQVTDPHLFADKKAELLGINTFDSFKAVLSEIQQTPFAFEFVLATGDLTQDNNPEGYRYFSEEISQLQKPVFWIPGNHDYQPHMVETLNRYPEFISPLKHIIVNNNWQILMLDSQVLNVPHGYLNQYQLDWLIAKIEQYPDLYTLVVLHHHIAPTRSAWLDQHNLRNTSEFLSCLQQHRHIKAIISGHIHQEMDTQWNTYRILTTPSTCIQFKSDSYHFNLDILPPGWREFELYPDGSLITQVKRLKQNLFIPDFNISGY